MSDKFSEWVYSHVMTKSPFTCNSDVRIDLPEPDDSRFFALWAEHDCDDYDLLLTVVLDARTVENFVGYVGADMSQKGCVPVFWFEETVACEFDLKAGNPFAILFAGGFTPVFYTTKWI